MLDFISPDGENSFWSVGIKLLVLVVAICSTLWLWAVATRLISNVRLTRDRANAADAEVQELARRDPLTGLRNRLGFIQNATQMLNWARANNLSSAMVLMDIDHLEAVNDLYGHEASDTVLSKIAARIARWDGSICTIARLDSNDFGMFAIGMEGIALDRFTESIRQGVAACDHSEILGDRAVTASIGVAEVSPACDLERLHTLAASALNEAKQGGGNQVSIQRHAGDSEQFLRTIQAKNRSRTNP